MRGRKVILRVFLDFPSSNLLHCPPLPSAELDRIHIAPVLPMTTFTKTSDRATVSTDNTVENADPFFASAQGGHYKGGVPRNDSVQWTERTIYSSFLHLSSGNSGAGGSSSTCRGDRYEIISETPQQRGKRQKDTRRYWKPVPDEKRRFAVSQGFQQKGGRTRGWHEYECVK